MGSRQSLERLPTIIPSPHSLQNSVVCSALVQKSKIFPNQTGSGGSHPRGQVMHGKGGHEASRRTAPAESTSIQSSVLHVLAILGRFLFVFGRGRGRSYCFSIGYQNSISGAVPEFALSDTIPNLVQRRPGTPMFYTFKCIFDEHHGGGDCEAGLCRGERSRPR